MTLDAISSELRWGTPELHASFRKTAGKDSCEEGRLPLRSLGVNWFSQR